MSGYTGRMAEGQRRAVAKRHELQAEIKRLESELAEARADAENFKRQRDEITEALLVAAGCKAGAA